MRRLLPLLLAVLLLDGGGALLQTSAAGRFHGLLVLPPQPVGDFSLVDQHGRRFRLQDQRGRVVVLAFGYTYCADLCPLTLGTLTRVRRMLASDGGQVRFVFVTVDPQRDTAARLRTYLAAFHPDFLGLTGPPPERGRVYRAFGIVPERYLSDTHRLVVNHLSAIFIVDPGGYLRLSYNWGGPAEDIVHDIRQLFAER
jgi:protein SCO1/2